jgi:hypothetical protein
MLKLLQRTVIRIESVLPDLLLVRIVGWNPHEIVYLPLYLISEALRGHVKQSARLFCKVNLAAEQAKDLGFQEFELAAELKQGDGLAAD